MHEIYFLFIFVRSNHNTKQIGEHHPTYAFIIARKREKSKADLLYISKKKKRVSAIGLTAF